MQYLAGLLVALGVGFSLAWAIGDVGVIVGTAAEKIYAFRHRTEAPRTCLRSVVTSEVPITKGWTIKLYAVSGDHTVLIGSYKEEADEKRLRLCEPNNEGICFHESAREGEKEISG